ncbi:CLUMA_CG013764, isoform A [Clunio marinus]|uniref:CLUMA_CG013759, isoform A n=1 Tax=Clunio marinus TaxID=568069 RepID=A0A1J1IJT4_9DIPT|nr:CLUMA_CG013759, isoform A [Clunio marinus]CRL00503.1 CLUMA_CG013764, isoform A [Clunio marinus]
MQLLNHLETNVLNSYTTQLSNSANDIAKYLSYQSDDYVQSFDDLTNTIKLECWHIGVDVSMSL